MSIEGKIERVLFRNPDNGFIIARFKGKDGTRLTLKGTIPTAYDGMRLHVEGEVKEETGGKYAGQQYMNPESFEEILPDDKKGIKKYLVDNIDGVGPKLADEIVSTFGDKTLEVFADDPQRLAEVPGLGEKKCQKILASWEEHRAIEKIMVFLKKFDISNVFAFKIYHEFGEDTMDILSENPYLLAARIDGIGFKKADSIALKMGIGIDSPERIQGGITFAMESYRNSGSTCTTEEDLIALTASADVLNIQPELVKAQLDVMIDCGSIVLEELEDGTRLCFLPVVYATERKVAGKFAAMNAERDMIRPEFDEKMLSIGVELDPTQKEAVMTALFSHMTVITGGPGTGKTTILKAVLAMFEANKYKVALASPTGRAAKRMRETTGHDATTIHRLLGYKKDGSGQFDHDEENPLNCDAVIVDEASMIDLILMNSLLKALKTGTRLVLVGDIDQLPSVGCGNVLRDVIDSGVVSTVRLTKVFRQAEQSAIVTNAHKINRGEMPAGGKDFYYVKAEDTADAKTKTVDLVNRRLPEYSGVKADEIAVLCPNKVQGVGTEWLNSSLQTILNPQDFVKNELSMGEKTFREGDKVMQIRNNYEKDVFNGDVGVVKKVNGESGRFTVDFYGNEVEFKKAEMIDMELAYAQTVHKSQGSEYDVVVIPVCKSNYISLSRNLLYTAVTRAKKLCVLVGQWEAVAMAVNAVDPSKRRTRLAARLVEYSQKYVN